MPNVYIDTNIVVDLCDEGRPMHIPSLTRIDQYLDKGYDLYINSDSMATLFYILISRAKLSIDAALEKLEFVQGIFDLSVITPAEISEAIAISKSQTTPHTDYEDALQYICAQKIDAEAIITNDRRFVSSDIPVISSEDN
jgi:predicted nucleic acid-binding protein